MDPQKVQSLFLKSVADPFELRRLFEQIPGILFFMKDADSRLIMASQGVLNRMGASSEAEVIGSSDYDYFPREIADSFIADDRRVLKTGQPLINRLEIAYDEQRILGWHLTTKLPVRGKKGEILGIMGLTHSYDGRGKFHGPFAEVSRAIEFVRKNYPNRFTMPELAQAAGMSERSLNRKFHEAFHLTPHEFVTRTRIRAASDELARTDKSILDIALDSGFCDQSAFTAQFRKRMGITPREFRLRYR